MADIFVSYTRSDSARAVQVASALQRDGYSVYFDQSIATGDSWDRRIESELGKCAAVVVLWSPASRDRQWVRNEARFAMSRGILCPALIETCQIPVEFSHIQAADLRESTFQSDDPGWQALLLGVGRLVPVPSQPAAVNLVTGTREADRNKRKWIAVAVVAVAVGISLAAVWFVHPPEPPPAAEVAKTTQASAPPKANETKATETPAPSPAKKSKPKATVAKTPPKTEAIKTPDFIPFDASALNSDVRAAVERARDAESRGKAIAQQAREAEEKAENAAKTAANGAAGTTVHHYPDSLYTYEGEWSDGKPNGYGIYSANPYDSTSTRWAGEFHGRPNGLVVHFWMQDNAVRNTYARFTEGKATGPGVLNAGNEGEYAGEFRDDEFNGYGVLRSTDGSRVEGQWVGGINGFAVQWTRDGRVGEAGVWKDGKVVTPLLK